MKAVIMAGGKGTRLRPLTCDLPKPMVPVLNYPVMEHIINLLKEQGITEIAVTTFYLPGLIKNYFEHGEKWGVNLRYYIEETPLGTAGSVHNADEFLDETFMVISGDAITDFDLKKAVDFHKYNSADATLVLSKEEIPLDYGVVMTDDRGEIIRFLEKPGWGQVFSDTINTGIYILEPDIFNLYEKDKKYDFSKDLFPLMLRENKKIYGIPLTGYWNDIGDLTEYHNTQFDFMNGNINLPFQNCREIKPGIMVEEEVEIADSAELRDPLYIGAGSKIEDGVILENSVIGKNNLIKEHGSIKQSIIWDNNSIGKGVELRGSIVTSNIILKDRVCIYDHTALGKKVIVGEEARIKPGVKVWPEKEIEAGTEVESSIIWSPVWSQHLFNDTGVAGQGNIDITPEFVAKLATAYASTLRKNQSVTVSSDRYKITSTLKSALIAGLRTAGLNVVDIGETITSVVRYSINKLKTAGGVHIRTSYKKPENIVIEFLDNQGVNLTTNGQKSIEKKFFAEDYNRVSARDTGEYSSLTEMNDKYIEEIIKNIDETGIKRNFYSMIIDYEYLNLHDILPKFLKKLNCQIVSTKNYTSDDLPWSFAKRIKARDQVENLMKENKSDLGIIVDHNAENIRLISQERNLLTKAQYQVLISYLLLERGIEHLYLPLNAPRVIEEIAGNYNVDVNYTPISPQIPMKKYINNVQGKPALFYPFTDAIYGLGLILEKMARDNISFDQLLHVLPDFFVNNAQISCEWQDKGKVMRYLSDNARGDIELIDGIKFNHENGWALIIPDSEKPVFHVFAEGEDAEAAESLTGFYLEKVKNLIKKEK